ncbi:MAG TPA: c-type cytochrome [Vicinamibacteria bacterium]|nr:c-type cytochrome [Vicinamibacteria bacterium]
MRNQPTRHLAIQSAIYLIGILTYSTLAAAPLSGDDDVELGKEVYERACLECHGDQGHGDGKTSRERKFQARDFALGSFKCRCTPNGELPTDEDLLRTVTKGIPGTPMRKFEGTLSLEERRAVVAYIKSLTPRFANEQAPACTPVPEPLAATAELIYEGSQVYRVMRCWTCHGVDGGGQGPAARGLKDDWGNPIRVYDFTRANRFKCGGSEADIYRLLHTGMNGSPMPSFSDAFFFPSESAGSARSFEDAFDANGIEQILDYIATQPDNATLDAMTPAEKEALRARRTWALVHYLRSLGGR